MVKILLSKYPRLNQFSLSDVSSIAKSILYPTRVMRIQAGSIRQYTIDETIDTVLVNRLSLARFGDGEIAIMAKSHGVGFQEVDDNLSKRLLEVYQSQDARLLIGLPDQFSFINNSVRQAREFWINFVAGHEKFLRTYTCSCRQYGNSGFSRFYMTCKAKAKAGDRFQQLKNIWKDLDVLIVEGDLSRSGVGNDLFAQAKSVSRIICPAKNAFRCYDAILNETKRWATGKIVLIALGPTATILAHDLALLNFWAIDLGHVDVEYMWMLQQSRVKKGIPGRHVNECISQAGEIQDSFLMESYQKEIIAKIIY